jgi:hypothetical protein
MYGSRTSLKKFSLHQKIYICLKGKNDIPIIQLDNPLKITELEEKASEIASFLKVPVKST